MRIRELLGERGIHPRDVGGVGHGRERPKGGLVIKYLAVFALGVVVGCPTPLPPAPVPPDSSDAAPLPPMGDAAPTVPCEAACGWLREVGCPEGRPSDCVTVLAHMEHDRVKRRPCDAALCPALTCMDVAQVRSPADARALGIPCAQ